MSSYTPVTQDKLNSLNQLSTYKLGIETIGGKQYIAAYDLHIFLQKYIGLLQFDGQYAQSAVDFSTSGSQLLATWENIPLPNSTTVLSSFFNTFTIRIGCPFVPLKGDVGSYQYKIITNSTYTNVNGTVAYSPQQSCITMLSGIPLNTIDITTGVLTFVINYYVSDGHYEFGFTYGAVAGATSKLSTVSVYCEPPTIWDGNIYSDTVTGQGPSSIPVLNNIASTPLTASPTESISLVLLNSVTGHSRYLAVGTIAGTSGFPD